MQTLILQTGPCFGDGLMRANGVSGIEQTVSIGLPRGARVRIIEPAS